MGTYGYAAPEYVATGGLILQDFLLKSSHTEILAKEEMCLLNATFYLFLAKEFYLYHILHMSFCSLVQYDHLIQ